MEASPPASPKWIALTLLAPISWGTTYLTTTELLPHDRPLFVASTRVVLAGVALALAGTVRTRGRRPSLHWRHVALLGLFNFAIFFPLLMIAVDRLPGGVAASAGGTQPLLVGLFTWAASRRRPSLRQVTIGSVAFAGVALVVIRPDAHFDPVGIVAALLANVSFSIGVVLTKRLPPAHDRLTATGAQLLISAVLLVPLALAVEGPPPSLNGRGALGVAYLGFGATGLAFILWFAGIRRLPAHLPPVLGLAAPLTGAALGWLVLDQSLRPLQMFGFAVTLAAITYSALTASQQRVEPVHTNALVGGHLRGAEGN